MQEGMERGGKVLMIMDEGGGAQTATVSGGVTVYERAVLIRNTMLGKEMVAAMGNAPVVICRGHGITSAAATVQHAVLQAISLDALARMSLQVRAAGGTLRDIDDADWDELPDLGPGFTTDAAWRSEVARLDHPS